MLGDNCALLGKSYITWLLFTSRGAFVEMAWRRRFSRSDRHGNFRGLCSGSLCVAPLKPLVLRYLMKYAQMDYILISPLKTKLILLWLWLGQAAVSLGRHNAPAIHSSEILVSLPNPLVKNRNKLQQIRQQNSDKAVHFLLLSRWRKFQFNAMFIFSKHTFTLTFRGKKFLQIPFSIIQNPSGCRSILSKDDKFDYTTKSMFTKYLIPLDSF